jgi:Domain of unknown function (DUF4326)
MGEMPQRIQLRRTRGWRMPEGAVNVARSGHDIGRWGNPFRVGHKVRLPGRWGTEAEPYAGNLAPGLYGPAGSSPGFEIRLVRDRADAVALYSAYYGVTWDERDRERIRRELAGHDLACWCPPPEPGQPDICHGAVLLRMANG